MGKPGLLTYDPATPIEGIASAVDRIVALPWDVRRDYGMTASRHAQREWSWETVADKLLGYALAR
jgi:hypothetical protein